MVIQSKLKQFHFKIINKTQKKIYTAMTLYEEQMRHFCFCDRAIFIFNLQPLIKKIFAYC